MNSDDLKKQVRDYLIKTFLLDIQKMPLENNASFLEQGIIDSTGILEVINYLQETFEIEINDNEVLPENLDSIDNIAAFLKRKKTGVLLE